METSSKLVPFPLLENASSYNPSTMRYREEFHSEAETTPVEKVWLNIFRKSIPGFTKRASDDAEIENAVLRAERFANRFGSILDDIERNPISHGGPHSCISLCRLRELVLREVGFDDIFKKVKALENANALKLLPNVIKSLDSIENLSHRIENVIKGVFAGNIFDLGAAATVDMFEKEGVNFETVFERLLPRPWVIDDLDRFTSAFISKTWKKVIIFCDNAGADIILGVIPFARELLKRGSKVFLAANDIPAINDITYLELLDVMKTIKTMPELSDIAASYHSNRLIVVNSGSDLPVIDLSEISQELAFVASDAELIVLEGMGRSIETNLNAKFKCDSLNIGMVKHQEVADYLGGRMYDCVIRFKVK